MTLSRTARLLAGLALSTALPGPAQRHPEPPAQPPPAPAATEPKLPLAPALYSSSVARLDTTGPLPDAPQSAQQSAAAPPTQTHQPETQESPAQAAQRQLDDAAAELEREKKQRIGGVVPNFNVVLNGKAPPLSAAQKWNLAIHSSTDPFYFASGALLAGFSEINDSHQGYHWGPKGYFKRVGASYADNVNGTLVGNALLPILFHQDPRYFRVGQGPRRKRLISSALSTIVCRGDNGRRQFNYSNVLGNFVSGAISNIYYPSDETGLELTLTNGAVVTAQGALGALFLEFAPDVVEHIRRKHEAARLARTGIQPAGSGPVTPGPSSPAGPSAPLVK